MAKSDKIVQFDMFCEALEKFCKDETKGRDKTHGVEHMCNVRELSIRYLLEHYGREKKTLDPEKFTVLRIVTAVAQFHDIADHKYITDPEKLKEVNTRMIMILKEYFGKEDVMGIMSVIDHISFSKENKFRKKHGKLSEWENMLGKRMALVRNIVSDADKYYAIGVNGLKRCEAYTREKFPDASNEKVYENVIKHCHEKLFRLYDDGFFMTEPGKKCAFERTMEMKKHVAAMYA